MVRIDNDFMVIEVYIPFLKTHYPWITTTINSDCTKCVSLLFKDFAFKTNNNLRNTYHTRCRVTLVMKTDIEY